MQNYALSGAMEGLKNLMINFPPKPEDESICQRIYVCMKKMSEYKPNIFQKAPYRSSIELFIEHCHLFTKIVYDDFNYWNKVLEKWKLSQVIEDTKRGTQALHAFHKSLSTVIKSPYDDNSRAILKCLIYQYCKTLENPVSKSIDIRIAIRGFGLLSSSCFDCFPEIYQKLVTLVIQKTELIAITEDKELKDHLEHFPDYIQALSHIILEGKDKQCIQILARNIQKIIIRFFKDFHYLSSWHTAMAVDSLCSGFYNLMAANTYLADGILEEVS